MDKLLAVTAIGPDRTGIVRDVGACISDAGGNIRESRSFLSGATDRSSKKKGPQAGLFVSSGTGLVATHEQAQYVPEHQCD